MGHQPRSTPLSPEEKARRSVALTVAETATPMVVGRVVQLNAAPQPTIIRGVAVPTPAPEPHPGRILDHPVVTVTISGLPGSGKSVIAHLIRNALAYEGIATEGPEGLRSLPWRRGVQDLIRRGARVVLQRSGACDA